MFNRQNQRRNFGSAGNRRDQQQNRSGINTTRNSTGSTPNPWLSSGYGNDGILSNSSHPLAEDPQTRLALARNLLNEILTVHTQQQPAPLLGLGNFSSLGGDQYNSGRQLYTRDRYGSGSVGSEGRYTGVTTGVSSRNKPKNNNNRDNKGKQFEAAQPRKAANVRPQNKFPPKKTKLDVKQAQATKSAANDTLRADNTKINESKNNVRKDDSKKQEVKEGQKDSNTTEVEKMEVDESEQRETNMEMEVEGESEKGTDKSKDVEKNDEPKKENVKKKSRYADVPSALLYCHICEKHMWDDVSFEKHLEGRIHKMMIKELDELYNLKVNFLRQSSSAKEKQKEYELTRNSRKPNKKPGTGTKGYCTMCNLNFLGPLPMHRRGDRHQNLKKFIHPKCSLCVKEFYTRLEWDEHKLSSDHLTKLGEYRRTTKPHLKDDEHSVLDLADELQNNDLSVEEQAEEIKNEGEKETVDLATLELSPGKKHNLNKSRALDEIIAQTEQYLVGEVTGFLCRACNRFLPTKEHKKNHMSSTLHRNTLSNLVHLQSRNTQKRKASTSTVEKIDGESNNTTVVDEKRLKLENEDDMDANKKNEDEDIENNDVGKEKTKVVNENRFKLNGDSVDVEEKSEDEDIEGIVGGEEKTEIVKGLLHLLDNTVTEIQIKVEKEGEEIGSKKVGSQNDVNVTIGGESNIETKKEEGKDVTTDAKEDKNEKEVPQQEVKVNIPPQKARRGRPSMRR